MSTTSIHDLLDAISSGQATARRLSVDDLVRAGRRRQRGVVAGVAGGTAAVIAVAGVAVGADSGGTRSGAPAASASAVSPSLAPTAAALVPAAPTAAAVVPALPSPVTSTTVTQPPTQSTSAAPAPSGGHLVPISNLNVLDHQTKVWTQVYAHRCVSFPQLSVQETATEVRLSLYLTMPPTAASVAAHDEYPLCSSNEVPTDPNGGGFPLYDGNTSTSLSSPVGTRRVVDTATGRTIPYADQDKAAVPTWLPPGFKRVGTIDPEGRNGWSQDWQIPHPKSAIVWQELTYFDAKAADEPPFTTTNTTVNGHPAWLNQSNKSSLELQWTADGVQYFLSEASTTDGCPGMATILPDAECNQGAKVPAAVTKAELLRIAESFAVPPS